MLLITNYGISLIKKLVIATAKAVLTSCNRNMQKRIYCPVDFDVDSLEIALQKNYQFSLVRSNLEFLKI